MLSEERKCGVCGLPIHPSEPGVRSFGFYSAHLEYRCVSLLRGRLEEAEAELHALLDAARSEGPSPASRGEDSSSSQGAAHLSPSATRSDAQHSAGWRKLFELYEAELLDLGDELDALPVSGGAGFTWTVALSVGHWRCVRAFIADAARLALLPAESGGPVSTEPKAKECSAPWDEPNPTPAGGGEP